MAMAGAVEGKRVLVVEDDPEWQEMIREALREGHHEVVATAGTIDEALAFCESGLRELRVEAATVDANLNPLAYAGLDGKTVVKAIRMNMSPGFPIRIIAVTTNQSIEGADALFFKKDLSRGGLSKLIGER